MSKRLAKLRDFLNTLSVAEQEAFAIRCETTINYLRKAISRDEDLREALCIAMERESNRAILVEDCRPDVDWAYIRGSSVPPKAAKRA